MEYLGRFAVRTSILIACFLVPASSTSAQSVAASASRRTEQSCTISGKVVLAGEPAPGVTVVVFRQDDRSPVANRSPVARAKTDEAGHYHLTGLTAGEYHVNPFAPVFVPANPTPSQYTRSIKLNEGETAQGLDFEMVRGGVITGTVTGADGQPIVDEVVEVFLTGDNRGILPDRSAARTDDRGVYRIYGVPPGQYLVAVPFFVGRFHQTYSPDVTDRARATRIEVESGAETSADIAVGAVLTRYSAGGHAIDSDTNRPAPNVSYAFTCVEGEEKGLSGSGDSTDSNGVFGIENLRPGRYCVFVNRDSNYYCDPFFFEVTDQDLTGLELRLRRGAVVTGSAVIEGVERAEVLSKLPYLSFTASIRASDQVSYSMRGEDVRLGPDGSFRIGGLQPGQLRLDLNDSGDDEFSIGRVEVNGVDHRTDGITVLDGAQINGVRLVIAYNSGRIRGLLKTPAGVLPPGTLIDIQAEIVSDHGELFRRSSRVSAGGKFEISGLMDGEYELTVFPRFPLSLKVTVTNGQAPFTVIDLESKPQREQRQ